MKKPVSVCALLSTILAACPLFAAGQDEMPSMRANMEAQQRMMDLQKQMRDDVQRHMALLLAEGPTITVGQLPNGDQVIVDTPNGGGPGQPGVIARRAPRMEHGAFLGISASPVNGVLRDQLKLPRGTCLVVDFVSKDSPAANAGVKVHDILEKIDDQLLINSEQLLVLVRNRKAGDEVTLTVLHEGQTVAIPVKLDERELPVLEDMQSESAPQLNAESIDMNPAPGVYQNWQHGKRTGITANSDGSITRTFADDDNQITLKTDKSGSNTLVVLDKDGHEVFNGPYTHDEQAKMPADVAQKVEELEKMVVKGTANVHRTDSMTLSRTDDSTSITIKISDTGRSCVVKNVDTGQTLFDGPIDTDQQIGAMDPQLADKVHKLLDKAGVK